jgi:heme-degrading monooxygenase HmoA
MIAVIFEVRPRAGQRTAYLEMAAALRPALAQEDGFISIERFESLSEPGRMLSLSFWRDEAAVRQWREHAEHRAAQRAGRESVFEDYRLRIATVVRDYGMTDRAQAPVEGVRDSCAKRRGG